MKLILLLQDNFVGTVIDQEKWQIHPLSDISITQNEELIMQSSGVAGILLGKVGGNFNFIDHTKDFRIKYKTRILSDGPHSAVATAFERGPEPWILQTFIDIDGVRKLRGVYGPPVPYNNEWIVCELTYVAETKQWFKKLKYEGDADWWSIQETKWEGTQPQGILLISMSLADDRRFPGPVRDHNTRFDNVEVWGTLAVPQKRQVILVSEGVEADNILSKSFKKSGNEVVDISQTSTAPSPNKIPVSDGSGRLNAWVKDFALKLKVVKVSANYTVTTDDCVILANATDGEFNIYLPPAMNEGLMLFFKKIDDTENYVNVFAAEGNKIEGGDTSFSLTLTDRYCSIVADGDNWWYKMSKG